MVEKKAPRIVNIQGALSLYSSKIKIIRCQLALMNSSSIVGFVS